ncbi:MAG: hypothetical protein QXJ11_05875 [Candidatus Bathyarchaeia archaeon]
MGSEKHKNNSKFRIKWYAICRKNYPTKKGLVENALIVNISFFDEVKTLYSEDVKGHLCPEPKYLVVTSKDKKEKVSVYFSLCPNCKRPMVVAKVETGQERTVYRLVSFNVARIVPPKCLKRFEDFLEAAVRNIGNFAAKI